MHIAENSSREVGDIRIRLKKKKSILGPCPNLYTPATLYIYHKSRNVPFPYLCIRIYVYQEDESCQGLGPVC